MNLIKTVTGKNVYHNVNIIETWEQRKDLSIILVNPQNIWVFKTWLNNI